MDSIRTMYESMQNQIPLESTRHPFPSLLGPVGILALADLTGVPLRTALTGTSSWLDILILAPGLHRQSTAADLNKGEYPACAAMTTGYVFRVENPATVLFLQRVGKTGHVTTLVVDPSSKGKASNAVAEQAYMMAGGLSLVMVTMAGLTKDFTTLLVLGLLILSRALNVFTLRSRSQPGWFGAAEPGVSSDLLVLASQDRWFRIEGLTDDVKAVTSGTWLRDATFLESFMVSCATVLVYLSAAISINATPVGKFGLLVLFTANAAFLGLANECTKTLTMFGRTISFRDAPKKYARRLDLTHELVKEFKRTDCFVAMGMIQPDKGTEYQESYKGAVMM